MGLMDKLNAKVKEFQLKSLEKQEEVTRKALDDQDNNTGFLADIQTKTLKHQITQQQKIGRQLTVTPKATLIARMMIAIKN